MKSRLMLTALLVFAPIGLARAADDQPAAAAPAPAAAAEAPAKAETPAKAQAGPSHKHASKAAGKKKAGKKHH